MSTHHASTDHINKDAYALINAPSMGKRERGEIGQRMLALAAERDAIVWQPIATVPRDGHPVAVYCDTGEIVTAKFWPGDFVCHVDIGNNAQHATHWREIDAPPCQHST